MKRFLELSKTLDVPSNDQLTAIDMIIAGIDPLQNLVEVATHPDAPLSVRRWTWVLLFGGTLSSFFYRGSSNGRAGWLDIAPNELAQQLISVNEIADAPLTGQPQFPGSLPSIPLDSYDTVWELLIWRLAGRGFSGQPWAQHLQTGSLRQCVTNAPSEPNFSKLVELMQAKNQSDGFEHHWAIMTDKTLPVWVRRRLIDRFLVLGEQQLPTSFSPYHGMKRDSNEQTATTNFAQRCMRSMRSPEVELCLQGLFTWLVRSGQIEMICAFAHWGCWGSDIFELLYQADRDAYALMLGHVLNNGYVCDVDGPNHGVQGPERLSQDFLLANRGLALVGLGSDLSLVERIDELIGQQIETMRSTRDMTFKFAFKACDAESDETAQRRQSLQTRAALFNFRLESPDPPAENS